jgi:N-acetylglucosaminyldiphosphoundecaprenol N-acetyl-beta-D-mannosaminyltransferase
MSSSQELPFPTYDVCGIPIAALPPRVAARSLHAAALAGRSLQVHLCNAYTLSLVPRDELLRKALLAADMNLPDGAPVAWLGREYGTCGPVRGPSLITQVMENDREGRLRHYLYGGAPNIALNMAEMLTAEFPRTVVAGIESPPYRDLHRAELQSLVERVEKSGANIVWVGLGTPKQDYLIPELASHLSMPVVPIGAAFDFLSGKVKEAPRWLQGTGLEWMHRFSKEPKRLWRRYLLGIPRFVWAVASGRWKSK